MDGQAVREPTPVRLVTGIAREAQTTKQYGVSYEKPAPTTSKAQREQKDGGNVNEDRLEA